MRWTTSRKRGGEKKRKLECKNRKERERESMLPQLTCKLLCHFISDRSTAAAESEIKKEQTNTRRREISYYKYLFSDRHINKEWNGTLQYTLYLSTFIKPLIFFK